VQALQFAARHRPRIEKKSFEVFCKANGGIAGCARRRAAHKKRLKTAGGFTRKKSLKTAGGLSLNNLLPSAPASNLQPPAPAPASAGSWGIDLERMINFLDSVPNN
jgi:hypothetical protein